jgi:hypothetical protein
MPHETVQLGDVNYTVYTFRDQPSSPDRVTATYFANRLAGADYRIGIPMPMITANTSEWDRCKAQGEVVLATLHADLTRAPLWRKYEYALAAAMLGPDSYPSRTLGNSLCEWEIYGRTQDKVYVYALCQDATSDQGSAASAPAVVHLNPDGSIGPVDLPQDGSNYGPSIQAMFPRDLWDKVMHGTPTFTFDAQAAMEHIVSRRPYPGTPPKIVEDGVELPIWSENGPTPTGSPPLTPTSDAAAGDQSGRAQADAGQLPLTVGARRN